MTRNNHFLAGVIEGFYGPPWSQVERFELFGWMAKWGLNTYLYAPKDDLKHRALWRELYTPLEAAAVAEVIRACETNDIKFFFALGPGLDIRFSKDSDLECLRTRFEQMISLGCENFALLFDDIPDQMHAEDLRRWPSFAAAQSHVTNALFRRVRELRPGARFLFCPTPYCGRMAVRGYGGKDYLQTIGAELLPEIDVLWTGPEIISREITGPHIRELREVLRRKPVIWDNLHANDYDGRRFYCGPYAGRPPELRNEVGGLLSNPNNEFPLNFVPLRTLAQFANSSGPWDSRKAYLSAMAEWLPKFQTLSQPMTLEELVLLGDCFYLPFEDGSEAEALYEQIRASLAAEPAKWGEEAAVCRQKLSALRAFCARLAELRQRGLFYALSRRVWELREELDLIDRYVEFKSANPQTEAAFVSDFHQPGTYRGGFVPRLQSLLRQEPDGAFVPTTQTRKR